MKFVKFIKKNSSLVIAISVVVLVLVAIFLIKNVFMFDENQAIYGSRLDGVKKVKISANQKSNAESKVSENSKKAKIRIAGKIVNAIITTNDDLSLEDAKKMGDSILEEFTDEQKKFYDFQFLIKNDKNKSQYPIIGYKQRSREGITWTRDRAES